MKEVGGFAESMGNKLPNIWCGPGTGAGVVIGHTAQLADSFDPIDKNWCGFYWKLI